MGKEQGSDQEQPAQQQKPINEPNFLFINF
jgi:hypothetical protein